MGYNIKKNKNLENKNNRNNKDKVKSNKTKYIIGILIFAVIISFFSVKIFEKKDYEGFASCLTDKGFVMAGAEWCSHCKDQKKKFNGAFESIIIPKGGYKDCDYDKVWCSENNITGFPTWITPSENKLVGVQSLNTLSKVSGCNYN